MQLIMVADHHDPNLMTVEDAITDHANTLVIERLPFPEMIARAKNCKPFI